MGALPHATASREPAARRREIALLALGLALLAALVYGDHVVRGGLLWDDWENAGTTRYRYEPGFLGPFDLRQAAYRPVLALLLPLPHLVFGVHPALHLLLALALAVLAAASFESLLRALGAPRVFAFGAAGLALVFPWSDSTRLWATASVNLVALVLVFSAATISTRALAGDARGPRARVALSAALLAAGILTYEAVAGLVLLLPLLYRLRAPWRMVLRRWWTEALAGGAAALLVALATTKPEDGAASALEHARTIASEGAALLGRALTPWLHAPPALAIVVAAGVVAVALAVRRRAARRPAVAAALSLVALVLAWAPFVPGEAKYVPAAPGIYDRVNIVAGFALAALVCSLAALAGTLVRGRARLLVPVAIVVAIGAGWAVHARADVDRYDRAAAERRAELDAVAQAVPHPVPGTTIVVFHDSDWFAPGVPIFGHDWDLGAAVKLRYGDPSLASYPVARLARVVCGPDGLLVDPAGAGVPPPLTPYAHAVLVDVRARRSARMSGAKGCRTAVAAFRRIPGGA